MAAEVVCVPPVAPRATVASGVGDELYRLFLAPSSERLAPPAPPAAKMVAPAPSAPTPAPTGCKQNGTTRSVVVIAGVDGRRARLRAALERTKYVAAVSKRNGNRMSYVFLGGALPPEGAEDEGVLAKLLDLRQNGSGDLGVDSGDVHLVVGAREMQGLAAVAEGPRAPSDLWEYLKHSVVVECLGPPGMPDTGRRGIWLKAISTQGVVGQLPGVGVVGGDGELHAEWIPSPNPVALVPWKDAVNHRWSLATEDPWKCKEGETRHRFSFWAALAAKELRVQEHAFQNPAEGLRLADCDEHGGCDSIAVFARETAAFGAVRRSMKVCAENKLQLTGDQWLDVGAESDSLYWATLSYCGSTKKALAEAHMPPRPDRTSNATELQRDVNVTLSSLVQHEHRVDALAPPTEPYALPERLVGQIGPIVIAGRGGGEVLRAIQFATPGADDVLVLMPDQYVQLALKDHHRKTEIHNSGARTVAGVLVLRDEDAIQLKVPDVSPSEQADAAASMGTRIWRLPPGRREGGAVAEAIFNATDATAGRRLKGGPPGVAMFYTATDVGDPLAGLRVKWTFAPGSARRDMPTLVVA